MSSLALLPFALAFAWLALQRRRPAFIAASGVFCALVALTNFYGATALAIFYPILVWSLWVTHRDNRMWLRAAAIPALAYGLSAFWLTPSYLRITLDNLRYVSSPGNALVGSVAGPGCRRFPGRFDARRVSKTGPRLGSLRFGRPAVHGLERVGTLLFQLPGYRRAAPPGSGTGSGDDSGGVELLRRMWIWPARMPVRWCGGTRAAVLLVLCAAWQAHHYVRHAWEFISARAGLPAARRIPHVRLDGCPPSTSAHVCGRLGAILVGHLARPGAGGWRIGPGPAEYQGSARHLGNSAGAESRIGGALVDGSGRGCSDRFRRHAPRSYITIFRLRENFLACCRCCTTTVWAM